MMFAVRGIAVSFSIFVILYAALSVLVCGLWRRLSLGSQRHSPRRNADLLFALRMFPFVLACGITLAFAVPSFLMLEPHTVDEPMSGVPVALGLCGMAALLVGVGKAARAWLRACRAVAGWSRNAQIVSNARDCGDSLPPLQISESAPPLTAAGILRPSVWLSRAAEIVLTEPELRTALQHEVVHVRRKDNLRKLVLRLVDFPGMAELEGAWHEATEMAADDAAVSSASEALDLAAAVIKLSRLTPLEPPAELTTALVHSPTDSVNARVERLIAWTDRRQASAPRSSLGYALCAAVAGAAALAVTYSQLLVRVHAATEWLVR
jgi:beta-lactamase regulating signal transducer with metallopeptidase domain